jgi:hypothetical protein
MSSAPSRRRWLIGALALAPTWPAASSAQGTTAVPTVTRLVKVFQELETQFAQAARAGDTAALEALLTDDFELRVARRPAEPVARAQWLAAIKQQPAPDARIEQMAAHDHGAVVDVSFVMRPVVAGPPKRGTEAPLFIVDTWARDGDAWRLKVRYAGVVGTSTQRVPGEGTATGAVPKKY